MVKKKPKFKSDIIGKPSFKQRIKFIQKLQPEHSLSKEQELLQEVFSGESTMGTGESLPKIHGILRSGEGLINNNDGGETASMFGLR